MHLPTSMSNNTWTLKFKRLHFTLQLSILIAKTTNSSLENECNVLTLWLLR